MMAQEGGHVMGEDGQNLRLFPLELEFRGVVFLGELWRSQSIDIEGTTSKIGSGMVHLKLDGRWDEVSQGQTIVVFLKWPILLDGKIPLQLELQGTISEKISCCLAVKRAKYEFKTRRSNGL